ncbi:hypothetical protein K8R42_01385 [bacterium]|nr:hypothetical protein [bacterium]
MWGTAYIATVKRALRDEHNFEPQPGSTDKEPLLEVPDGEYLVTIEGKLDKIRIEDGHLMP